MFLNNIYISSFLWQQSTSSERERNQGLLQGSSSGSLPDNVFFTNIAHHQFQFTGSTTTSNEMRILAALSSSEHFPNEEEMRKTKGEGGRPIQGDQYRIWNSVPCPSDLPYPPTGVSILRYIHITIWINNSYFWWIYKKLGPFYKKLLKGRQDL